jgi:hypothetical protein
MISVRSLFQFHPLQISLLPFSMPFSRLMGINWQIYDLQLTAGYLPGDQYFLYRRTLVIVQRSHILRNFEEGVKVNSTAKPTLLVSNIRVADCLKNFLTDLLTTNAQAQLSAVGHKTYFQIDIRQCSLLPMTMTMPANTCLLWRVTGGTCCITSITFNTHSHHTVGFMLQKRLTYKTTSPTVICKSLP